MRNKGMTVACIMLSATVSYAATPHEVSIMDPSNNPTASVVARVGDGVSVILPLYPGIPTHWTYASVDGAMPAGKEEVVQRWMGPNTHGDKFTFTTARVAPGDHVLSFKNDPNTAVAVTIHLTN